MNTNMPKLVYNSRNNRLTAVGLIDYIEDRIDQYVLMTSNVEFNAVDVTTHLNVGGDVVVTGNLTVNGGTTSISTQVVELEDNIILINSAESGSGVGLNLSGVEVNRGALTNFQAVFQESSDLYKIGEVGNLQAVATREDSPLDKGILVFNDALNRLDSTNDIAINITFSGNTESTTSNSGSIKVLGGIGASGNISLDKAIRFLGSNYSSEIRSNISDDLILSAGNHLRVLAPIVKIQDSTLIELGASGLQTISNSGSNINISATSGDINVTTASSGKVVLPEQTYVRWGTAFNDLVFDGTDINLRSTGKFNILPNTTINGVTPTTSPTTGSLVLSGGLGVSGSQNSVNSDNGGAITVAGGASVKKVLRIGDSIDIGDANTTVNPGSNIGVNFRSRNKTLTSNDTNNITFNSFEGGAVDGSGSIQEASTVLISSAPSGINVVEPLALHVQAGNTKFGGIVYANSSTASSSSSVGSLVVAGGISISNATDSTSSSNGGSFTTAGGIGVTKSVKIGDSLRIGEINAGITQQLDSGLNFRSLSRTITTASTVNATFNSFEGGILDTSSTVPEASTLLIKSAPTTTGGGSIQNPLALLVQAGNSKFNGKISSTSTVLDSVALEGGLKINNVTDSSTLNSNSSLTSLGGASIAKNLLVGNSIKTSNGTNSAHLLLANTSQNSRFSINLKDVEAGSNSGSNLEVVRYSDAGSAVSAVEINRNNSDIIFKSTTNSTSITAGSILTNGGVSINCSTDATTVDNGGSFTSAGGASVKKKLFVGGNTTLSGGLVSTSTTNLNKTTIDTTAGSFDVSGTNGLNATLGNSSNLSTTAGSLTLSSNTGALVLSSSTTTGITVGTNLNISTGGNTVLVNGSGNTNVTSLANNLTSSSGANTLSSFGLTSISAGTGGIIVNTIDTTNGIKIGTLNSGVPISLGHSFSQTVVNGDFTVGGNFNVLGTLTTIDSTIISIADNAFVVNAAPSGISDGGFLMRRYQTPNDSNTGQVILDTPKVSSTFQSGSTASSLNLNGSSNAGTNYYRGWWIKITSGPASGSTRRIKSYDGTTKTAIIYTALDNNEYNDGLDLASAPLVGNTYQLFDVPYAGIYFSESAQEVVVSGISFDQSSGTFGTPTSYLPLHVQTLVTETGLTLGGNLSVNGVFLLKNEDVEVFKITNNLDQTVLNSDSINGELTIALPSNVVNSGPSVLLSGLDSASSPVVYSSVKSIINNNLSGSLDATILIRGQTGNSGLVEIARLNGDTSTLSSKLVSQNTTSSSSVSSASVVTNGGVSINCATDAVSEDNGGGISVAGGASVKKKVFIGGESVFTKGKVVGNTSNVLVSTASTLNVDGDIGIYGTSGKLFFGEGIPVGVPTFSSRSVGTKVILNQSVAASTVDTALGTSNTGMWLSAADTSKDISFYLGTTKLSSFENAGLNLPVNGSGVNLDGASLKSSSSNKTLFSPSSNTGTAGLIFTDNAGTLERTRFNGLGQIKACITNTSITSTIEGAVLDINNSGITDATTIASGTVAKISCVSIKQNTLSAASTGVTTTVAASLLVSGAIVKGTNEIFGASAGVYIDSVASVNTSGDTIPLASSLFIKDSPTGNNITKSRAIFVESGIVEAGDVVLFTKGKVVGNTSNVLVSTDSTLNVDGDIGIYGTSGKLFFGEGIPVGVPTFSTRSVGTKVILNQSIAASTVDTAVGTSSTGIWLSAADTTKDISFYLGTLCKVKVNGSGMLLDSGTPSSLFNISCPDDTTGINLDGGLSSLQLHGTGDCIMNSGVGSISLRSGANIERMNISSTGEILVSNTSESTSSSSASSIKTLGGISVAKSVSCGTSLLLDFNQPYAVSGETSGALLFQSKVSSTNSNIKYFTNDGDATDSNTITVYSKGTPGSQIDTESLSLGFTVSDGFAMKTGKTGTGSVSSLVLQSDTNSNQLKLETDGSVSLSSNTVSSNSSTGALKLAGGLGISNTTDAVSSTNGGTITTAGGLAVAKKAFIGTDLAVGGNLTVVGTTAFPHGGLTGLTNDDHTIYTLNAGRTGGQVITGGIAASNDITIRSTSNATKGSVIFDETTSTTSSITGAVRLTGGLGISNATDAVSSTNGGTITTAGGLAVAKKVFIGTDLSVSGNATVSGILDTMNTSPTLTVSNATVATTQRRSSLNRNGVTSTLVANFTLTPVTQGIQHTFDITLPGLSGNLVDKWGITGVANGYTDTDINVENMIIRGVVGTTTARVRFTSANTALHTIHVLVHYTV